MMNQKRFFLMLKIYSLALFYYWVINFSLSQLRLARTKILFNDKKAHQGKLQAPKD
jgi:hypothetical protein